MNIDYLLVSKEIQYNGFDVNLVDRTEMHT